jgi:hypothetical protein
MSDFYEDSLSVPKAGKLRLFSHRTAHGEYHTGDFTNREGMVAVYRQEPDRAFKKGYTRLDAVIEGRVLYRSWERRLGRRSIYREARRLLGAMKGQLDE